MTNTATATVEVLNTYSTKTAQGSTLSSAMVRYGKDVYSVSTYGGMFYHFTHVLAGSTCQVTTGQSAPPVLTLHAKAGHAEFPLGNDSEEMIIIRALTEALRNTKETVRVAEHVGQPFSEIVTGPYWSLYKMVDGVNYWISDHHTQAEAEAKAQRLSSGYQIRNRAELAMIIRENLNGTPHCHAAAGHGELAVTFKDIDYQITIEQR